MKHILFFTLFLTSSTMFAWPWAYYPFDDTMKNVINDNTGTVVGPGYSTWSRRGKALYFDGVDDYANLSSSDNPSYDEFSISMWVKALDNDSNQAFIGKHSSTGNTNLIIFGHFDDQVKVYVKSARYGSSSYPATYDSWVHYAVTFQKVTSVSTGVKLYINGALAWQQTLLDAITDQSEFTNGKPWVLGQEWDGASTSDHLWGRIDDVKFYNYVLGSGEISELYSENYHFPESMEIYAMSINDFLYENDLSRSYKHKEEFVGRMTQFIGDENFAITTGHTDFEDSEVTASVMESSSQDNYDFVFISTHGGSDGPIAYDSDVLSPDEKGYNGDTYWVAYDACLTLYNSASYQEDRFDGLHSIIGNASIGWEFRIWNGGWQYSEEMWYEFADRWIRDSNTIWDAWKYAVYHKIYQDGGHGMEPAIVYKENIGSFSGRDERIWNTWQYEAESIIPGFYSTQKASIVFGTPDY